MTASAYHLFSDIYQRRKYLTSPQLAAENFMLRDDLVAARGGPGKFPDMVLRTNENDAMFAGGELIEIKDATRGYTIASFNSTIPSAHKNIRDYIAPSSKLYAELKRAERRDPYLLAEREVYYLIRGCNNSNYKVCLVQGGFFETVSESQNIRSALRDALNEAMQDSGADATAAESIDRVLDFNWRREHLAKLRKHPDAAVSIRMRVMAEVINEANLLNAKQYPAIGDNTLNMIVPGHSAENNYAHMEKTARGKMERAFNCQAGGLPKDLTITRLQHLRDGEFVLFQTKI